jgi:hypothetical protein
MDESIINSAKSFAEEQGKSLSKMVADYFSLLISKNDKTNELTPHVKALSGALKGSQLDIQDYKDHLEKKYL